MPKISPQTLVSRLNRRGLLHDPLVEGALQAVPRHLFLPGVSLSAAYADESVPLKRDASGQVEIASTRPSMTVAMLEQLRLSKGLNVLLLGAGSGYTAALLQHIVGDEGRVTAVEIDPMTARQAMDNLQRTLFGRVLVVEADGSGGYGPRANYDRILVNATVWDVPRAWKQQLKPDGLLVVPLWLGALQYSTAFHLSIDGLESADLVPSTFVPLRGAAQGPRVSLRVGGSALALIGDASRIDSAALHTLMSEPAEINYLGTPLTGSAARTSFLPYFMLSLPTELVFCLYTFEGDQLPYGMNRRGFAVLTRGSAAFISLEGDLKAFVFGGSDAFMAASAAWDAWNAAGRPGDDRLHVRLTAPEMEVSPPSLLYRRYSRPEHDLHVWLDL